MTFEFSRKTFGDVEEIIVGEITTCEELHISRRELTVRTNDGVKFELVVQADDPKKLEFQAPPDPYAWITPKIYEGTGEES